jgi:hypothetical protein
MIRFTFKLATIALLLTPAWAFAQDDAPQAGSSEWRHTVTLYGMGAAIDGTSQIGDLEVDIDISISELFEALEFGAMAAYRAQNDRWSVTLDSTWMALAGEQVTPQGRVSGKVDMDQFTFMASAGRRVTPNLEVTAGVAYFDLSTKLVVTGPLDVRQARADVSWVDPTVGLRYALPFAGNKWTFVARGDIGGFGVGSDFLYHLAMTFHRQQTENLSWFMGYRIIDFDYEEGAGMDYRAYDMNQQGPGVGLSWSF